MPGMRVGTNIIIYFDTKTIMTSGVKLQQSAAGAVLTSQHVPARAIISVRARENGAVKYVNIPRIEVCSTDERMVAIGNDHEKTIKAGMTASHRHHQKKRRRQLAQASLRRRKERVLRSKRKTSRHCLPGGTNST